MSSNFAGLTTPSLCAAPALNQTAGFATRRPARDEATAVPDLGIGRRTPDRAMTELAWGVDRPPPRRERHRLHFAVPPAAATFER